MCRSRNLPLNDYKTGRFNDRANEIEIMQYAF